MGSGEGTAVGKTYLVDLSGGLVVSAPVFLQMSSVRCYSHAAWLVVVAGSKRKGCGEVGQGCFPVPEWKSSGDGGVCQVWAMWGKWVRLTMLGQYDPVALACRRGLG